MTTSVQTPADVVNLALRRIGYKLRVASLYDGSDAAKAALDIYAQTRDAVLRESPWGFAEKIAAAASSGTPPSIWQHSYAYPADCIRLRGIYASSYLSDQNNPLPIQFTLGQDAVQGRVIWTNTASPTLVYTMRVTDPTNWDPLFAEAVAAAIGRRLVPLLGQKDLIKVSAEDEAMELQGATEVEG